MNAAAAGIRLARTAYLPRIEVGAAESGHPEPGFRTPSAAEHHPIDHRASAGHKRAGSLAWGSAAGTIGYLGACSILGLRQAGVEAANAARTQQEATLKRTEFEVAVAAADAYVTLVAAQETVQAAQAGVDRS